MKNPVVFLLTLVALLLCGGKLVAADARESDHQALRELLAAVTKDLNERKIADIAQYLDADCSLTFVDQTVIHDRAGLDQAFARWFAPGGNLASVRFAPTVVNGTIFTGPDTGWVAGTSDDLYTLTDGRSGVMPSHWTATVVRRGMIWKLSTLHAGVDPQDNAILHMVESSARRAVIITGIIALLTGGLISWLLMRRR
jgi:hypothetical protein